MSRRATPLGRALAGALGLWATLAAGACGHGSGDAPGASCEVLFGSPNERTGLDASRCAPRCSGCGLAFEPPSYAAATIDGWRTDWTLAEPFAPVTSDPYAGPPPDPEPADAVCAVLPGPPVAGGPRSYVLVDAPTEAAARAMGAFPTHFGRCGVCSSLGNLAVYARETDLTEPVRACGLESKDQDAHVACLEALGFDRPCAQIWYWNTLHTRGRCLAPCLAALGRPYHDESGALNECLACDERESGPVFKAVAGRTRRNSGLPNAMCRPCSEVRPLVHDYPTDGAAGGGI